MIRLKSAASRKCSRKRVEASTGEQVCSVCSAPHGRILAVRSTARMELLRTLRGLPDAHSVYPFGDAVHYADARADRNAPDLAPELRRELQQRGIADADVSPIEPGIEDVFMELMQRAPAAA